MVLTEDDVRRIAREEAEGVQEDIVTKVSQRDDEKKYYSLRRQARALPEGSRERQRVERRMLWLAPPTTTQRRIRRIAGIGLVAAITGFWVKQGFDTYTAAQVSQHAIDNILPNMGTALSHVHIDVFNLGKTWSDTTQAIGGVIVNTLNTAGNVVQHATETIAGFGTDVLAVALKPWRKPPRRGRIPI